MTENPAAHAQDGAAILAGLTQALREAGAAAYAEQVETAATAVTGLVAQQQATDAVWANIAASEHAAEIRYSFRKGNG